jgi:MoaA/NifB/PqqE/SkfB family radical SAM enzyme
VEERMVAIEDGTLKLSGGSARRLGLGAGAEYLIQETPGGLLLRRTDPALTRVHVEPTTGCNLSCRTCVRNSWDEAIGFMKMESYRRLIDELRGVESLKGINFWGLGEPLLHPHIAEMVAMAKGLGARTELITNGLLLTEEMSRRLVDAGLDSIVVSIDGVSQEGYGDVRSGGSLEQLQRNVAQLQKIRLSSPRKNPEVGLEFVAMRRNLGDLPKLVALGMAMGVTRVIVTNVLPYSEELKDEILYGTTAGGCYRTFRDEWTPQLLLPRMDLISGVPEAMSTMLSHLNDASAPIGRFEGASGYCRFVGEGSVSVGWDGRVAPCVPLMHSYHCFVMGREKFVRGYTLGNVDDESIPDIWGKEEYRQFRDRVLRFTFSPCTDCGGCKLAETNESDCAGNSFPVCGDCLWARGVIQCP